MIPQQFLQPPPGRRYVRSFLFSRRVDAPFARVHLIARIVLVLCLSGALLRTINTTRPDLFGAAILELAALLLLALSGVPPRVARLYFFLTLPALLALFVSWTIFHPVAGKVILVQQIPFFPSLTLLVTDRGLLVAVTKMIGYAGMIVASIALVMTARDTELIGALRQLHVPQAVTFFLSTVFRSLDLALADYETIRQAQHARAISARPRSLIRRLRDLASIAVPMVAIMIRRSSDIGDALLARGYTMGRPLADFYESSPWRWIDWIVVVLSLILLYFAVGPHVNLTTLAGLF